MVELYQGDTRQSSNLLTGTQCQKGQEGSHVEFSLQHLLKSHCSLLSVFLWTYLLAHEP